VLYLGRGEVCLLWYILQQDVIAYRLCDPFIVEFIYFVGHVEGGLNTDAMMLTEAEKLPVSLKPLWLQFTPVVKLRKLFLLLVTIFVGVSCLFLFFPVLSKNPLRKSSKPKDFLQRGFWLLEFQGYDKS